MLPSNYTQISQTQAATNGNALRIAINAGLEEARRFLETKVKETLGVPSVRGTRTPGGAPPRKITGNLQQSVRATIAGNEIVVTADARSRRGFPYGVFHESGNHPFITPTRMRYRQEVINILQRHISRVMKRPTYITD